MAYLIAIASTLFYLSTIYLIKKGELMKEFFKENREILISLTTIFIILLSIFATIYSQQDLGTFGDFFGGILNPLVGLAGVVLLFLTWQTTREELKETQKEFKQSNDIFEAQKREMQLQTFDNKFFQMLGFFNDIRNNLEIELSLPDKDDELITLRENKGVSSFKGINLSIILNEAKIHLKTVDLKLHISEYYRVFFLISNYFLTLYQILKFIDKESLIEFEQQKSYSNIIRSQFSEEELITILFNLYRLEGSSHKELIEKYSIFEHIEKSRIEVYIHLLSETLGLDEIELQKEIILKFKISAFGDNQKMIKWYKELKKESH